MRHALLAWHHALEQIAERRENCGAKTRLMIVAKALVPGAGIEPA
jgi:hypothetical protein